MEKEIIAPINPAHFGQAFKPGFYLATFNDGHQAIWSFGNFWKILAVNSSQSIEFHINDAICDLISFVMIPAEDLPLYIHWKTTGYYAEAIKGASNDKELCNKPVHG
jgi:hypothetical protein